MPKIGVVAGSGLYDIEGLEIVEDALLETPFGAPSSTYRVGRFEDAFDVVFLPRHGVSHEIPPHRVNYRANIYGFQSLGVEILISFSATGSLDPDLRPGTLVLLNQIIDMTSGRPNTFFDGPDVVHVDFTEPYCERARRLLLDAASGLDIPIVPYGTYVCTNGPRLETHAEIRTFRQFGADVVGMTAMPEAVLAREQSLCLVGVSVVTNPAAGLTDRKLTTDEVVDNMKGATENLRKLLRGAFPRLATAERECPCPDALKNARL